MNRHIVEGPEPVASNAVQRQALQKGSSAEEPKSVLLLSERVTLD